MIAHTIYELFTDLQFRKKWFSTSIVGDSVKQKPTFPTLNCKFIIVVF